MLFYTLMFEFRTKSAIFIFSVYKLIHVLIKGALNYFSQSGIDKFMLYAACVSNFEFYFVEF